MINIPIDFCFVAPVANSPRRDLSKHILTFNAIKSFKNFEASLYRFYQYTLNFKHDAQLSLMICFVADDVCVLIGSVKSLSVENFQSFYSMITYSIHAKRGTTKENFFEGVARKKVSPLANYKKVADNFKKGF